MENVKEEKCTKKMKTPKFEVVFKQDGDSFQNIMEKILISKLDKKNNE